MTACSKLGLEETWPIPTVPVWSHGFLIHHDPSTARLAVSLSQNEMPTERPEANDSLKPSPAERSKARVAADISL